jgi:RNA polymerase sigma-70 factor (ECF subfamily)
MAEHFDSSAGLLAGPLVVEPPSPGFADAPWTAAASPNEVFALVYRQVRALAGHRDVDELVQVAAEQVIRSLPRFAGHSKLSTWVFRICYLTIRKHDRWYRRWLRRFTLTDDGELPEAEASTGAAEECFIGEERGRRVRAALARLSPKRRVVVLLHDLEGLSIDEVATVVDAQPVAVRSRLRDARKALADILAKDPYFGVDACRREEGS